MRESIFVSSRHSASVQSQPAPESATRSANAPNGGTMAGNPAAHDSESVKLNVSGPAEGNATNRTR